MICPGIRSILGQEKEDDTSQLPITLSAPSVTGTGSPGHVVVALSVPARTVSVERSVVSTNIAILEKNIFFIVK
jgi:hypothetical protein